MQKNELITAVAEGFGSNGEGIVKQNGVTVFVPRLIPGERAVIRILKEKGNVAYGKIEELLAPAEERVRPRCPVFERCGGCQLQHMKYRKQLKIKTNTVKDTLRKIGGIDADVSECERSEKEYAYRNKLQLPIGHREGKNLVGFFAERSHRIIPTSVCPIHPDWSEGLIDALYKFMEKCGLDGYDEEKKTGQLRHIVVRELRGRFLITLVSTVRELKGIDYFFFLLDPIFSEYSFYLNINDKDTNVVFGQEFLLLKGKGFYECVSGGISFEAGANTFVQVNENVCAKLYDEVLSHVGEGEKVIDCYSGGGLLTAMLARKCQKAYGIEVVPEAGACAERVREKNGLSDKMFPICGKVEEELSSLLQREDIDTVVLDPPRGGVERSVLSSLLAGRVKKIVMVSCNPATLARDLGILMGTLRENEKGELVKSGAPSGDFTLCCVKPFDMFPQTKHVETLVVLERK